MREELQRELKKVRESFCARNKQRASSTAVTVRQTGNAYKCGLCSFRCPLVSSSSKTLIRESLNYTHFYCGREDELK